MKRIVKIALVLLLIADLSFTFVQLKNFAIDGDVRNTLAPVPLIENVFESPLGLKVFNDDVVYPNPNRFFSHWFLYQNLTLLPDFLQNFVDPVESVYLSAAIGKTLIHISIIVILAFLAVGTKKIFRFDVILAMFLITPLFHSRGFVRQMGIIDPSITYVFFFAFPIMLLLLYFAPLFKLFYYQKRTKLKPYYLLFIVPFALIISLSGPLNPGISLVLILLIGIYYLIKMIKFKVKVFNKHELLLFFRGIPKEVYYLLIPIGLLSLYSLYLGTFNSHAILSNKSLPYLYAKLPEGLYKLFTAARGLKVISIAIVINIAIVAFVKKTKNRKRLLSLLKWMLAFVIIYIILLPLGGYRPYRPLVIRYDTFIPVTLTFILFYAITSINILKSFKLKYSLIYFVFLGYIAYFFTIKDKFGYSHQRQNMVQLYQSTEDTVKLKKWNYPVLSWGIITEPEKSKWQCIVLDKWNIFDKNKRFYAEKPKKKK